MGKRTGADLIAVERQRQIDQEGYDETHDAEHDDGSLAVHAAVLAVFTTDASVDDPCERAGRIPLSQLGGGGAYDSWGLLGKHGGDRIRQLVIAGALIAAEIDRLGLAAAEDRIGGIQ